MKILWLGSGLLLPLDKGGKLRSWHLLRHLAARHEVTFLCFADPAAAPSDVDGMRQVCRTVETVPRTPVAKGTARFYLDAARYLADSLPYAVAAYRSRAYRERVASLLAGRRFDALVCDFLVPAVNMPADTGCPSLLFTHNVEAEIWRRHAETAEPAWKQVLLRSQWRRMLRFEGETVARFDSVLAVSEADRDTLAALYPRQLRGPVHVIPTGVDVEYFRSALGLQRDPVRLVFTGSMDWLPNEDGVLYFCREILPRIRQSVPDVRLSIVGRQPTPAVQRLAEEDRSIDVTGRVEDIRPHVGRARVAVVPLRVGGGTRLKIYEAMAMGTPVVSTTIGAEGLPLSPGRDLALADHPESFAAAVVRLVRNDQAWTAMADAALHLVTERYDWSAVAGALEHAIQATVLQRTVRAAPGRTAGRAAASSPGLAAAFQVGAPPAVPLPAPEDATPTNDARFSS
ncbi:MAG: glycosyltransferase [Acidobacteria bacterium]|nr:MAG: glycosyltransferase [Acidobacteriota bacterium]